MNLFIGIPLAPLPGGSLGVCIAAAIILAAALMLAIGHKFIWRIPPAVMMGFILAGGADYMSAKTTLNHVFATVGLGSTGAIIGLIAARLFWIIIFALLLGLIVVAGLSDIYAHRGEQVPAGFEQADTLDQWQSDTLNTITARKNWLLANHRRSISLALAATIGFGLLAGTHKPVEARVLSMCLIGSLSLMIGICYVIRSASDGVDFTTGRRPIIIAIVTGVAFIGSAAHQWQAERRLLARRREMAAEKTEAATSRFKSKEKTTSKPKKTLED